MEHQQVVRIADVANALIMSNLVTEWHRFYAHLSLAGDKSNQLRAQFRSQSFCAFSLISAMLEQWVNEKVAGATVQALADVLQKVQNNYAKVHLIQMFGAYAVVVPNGFAGTRFVEQANASSSTGTGTETKVKEENMDCD